MSFQPGSTGALLWRARSGNPFIDNGDPRIAVLIIGHGRDQLRAQTLASFLEHVDGYQLAHVEEIDDRGLELGFGGAIRQGWERLRAQHADLTFTRQRPAWDYIFHLEEDWRFERPVDVRHMTSVFDDARPDMIQVALRRNAVNQQEVEAGGLVELWPAHYTERRTPEGVAYLEHALHFTTNPSLYRSGLVYSGWPIGDRSEERFGQSLIKNGYKFAFLGGRSDAPWIQHTGVNRTGRGY